MKHFIFCLIGCFYSFLSFTQSENSLQVTNQKTEDTTQVEITNFLVFFPTASHKIGPDYYADLDRIASQILASGDTIALLGFTDNVGDSTFNQELSKKRASTIADYFIKKGLADTLIKVDFFGESQPLADNTTAEGRSQNRRVEIKVLSNTAEERSPVGAGNVEVYEPGKQEDLLKEIKVPETAKKVDRPLPVMPTPSASISFRALEDTLISSNGATAMIAYRYDSGAARPKSVLFQIRGASSFYDVPVTVSATKGTLTIPLSFSTELGAGEIAVVAEMINEQGQLSNLDTTYVKMERLGTGKIQISLSWENTSDQDLYLTLPSGEVISYMNDFSDSGGRLDRDDQDGFGPENIFWLDDAPDGTYTIEVNDYLSSQPENPFVVTFNGLGSSKQFYGKTRDGSTEWVATFVKKGPILMWLPEDKY